MKKYGFTIVELIVSIALIAMLSTILTVVIVKKMKSVKDTTYNLLIESIEVAAEEYALNNEAILTSYAENDWAKIPLSTLIEKGYFEEALINPKTKEELPITDCIYVTRSYKGKIESHYNINQNISPNITLNGKFNIYVKLNSPFEDPGVTAFDSDGNNVTNLVTKSGTVDTTQRGSYVVSYKYKTTTITRNVIVGDKKTDGIAWYTLTINPSGGYFNESNEVTIYNLKEGRNQDLSSITKEGSEFVRWDYTCTGCSITDGIFTMGTSDVTVVAVWEQYPKLTVNLSGGTTAQTFDIYYREGDTIELLKPIKSGSIFNFWSLSGSDAQLDDTVLTIGEQDVTLIANWLAYTDIFTYYVGGSPGVLGTDYSIHDDGNENWRIKFLKTGVFKPLINMTIDAFLVGGGGGGGYGTSSGPGGGGGYTGTWSRINLTANSEYNITIGNGGAGNSNGGATSAFSYSVIGGKAVIPNGYNWSPYPGGAGGSGGGANGDGSASTYWPGGNGGSDGSNGQKINSAGGVGQGTTTREFGEATGDLYAGGGGGSGYSSSKTGGTGGDGGGGRGYGSAGGCQSGTANTGGGGGGNVKGSGSACSGGSGIVVIRNTKIYEVGNTTKFNFSYGGVFTVTDGATDNWKIKFTTSGTFKPLSTINIDAFLVGGGGGGGCGIASGSGGGGGYTGTWSTTITAGQIYTITLGSGGAANTAGGETSAFGYSKMGGSPGSGSGSYAYSDTAGGAGGSGGGGNGSAVAYEYWNGGNGGSDGGNGSNGESGTAIGGTGQGNTTREFGELTGDLYAGGGGGAGYYSSRIGGTGGAGGGGRGFGSAGYATNGTANTGGGGGGANYGCSTGAGKGGIGTVVIRPS